MYNKSLRLLSLTLFLTIGIGIPSCFVCDCPPLNGQYVNLESVSTVNYRLFSPLDWDRLAPLDTVPLEQYRVEAAFETRYVSLLPPKQQQAFSFINSAYACNCKGDGDLGSKERIEKITVISRNRFNEEIKVGDTLNSLVELLFYNDTVTANSFMPRHLGGYEETFHLRLKEKPESGEALQLKLLFALDNGKVLETES